MSYNGDIVIEEFCSQNLENYRSTIEFLIHEIFEKGIVVHVSPTIVQSSFVDKDDKYFDSPTIRIGCKEKRMPIELVWSLLHEYGHANDEKFDGNRKEDPEYLLQREGFAWKYAETRIAEFPNLYSEISNYFSYRDRLLKTYRDKYKV